MWANRLFLKLARITRKRSIACVLAASIPVAIRLALLPMLPIPEPAIPDEVSYLLAADTFASGRLTNPTHPMWVHFETYHENMQPTYMSKYPPAQGLFLAIGQKLLGRPWYGAVISFGLMSACLCWMFQGWMPPIYAFLGTVLAIGQIGVLGYWMNSYWGGAIPAAGGALVLGALPRIAVAPGFRASALAAIGILLLLNSRPYEGFILVAACGVFLLWQRARRGRSVRELFSPRFVLPFALICGAGAVWMGYYNFRVTGSPLTLPYSINNKTYGVAPLFYFMPPPKPVAYRSEEMRRSYEYEVEKYRQLKAEPYRKLLVIPVILPFYCSTLLFCAMAIGAAVSRSVKLWSALGIWFVVWLAFLLETFFLVHYIAPATGAVFVGVMFGVRLLGVYGKRFGKTLVLLFVATVFTVGLIYGLAGGQPMDLERRRPVEKSLLSLGGRHLVMVRYKPDRSLYQPEWVFNAADIDASPVVWARDLGEAANRKLFEYYRDRKVWLFEPDSSMRLRPYTAP